MTKRCTKLQEKTYLCVSWEMCCYLCTKYGTYVRMTKELWKV